MLLWHNYINAVSAISLTWDIDTVENKPRVVRIFSLFLKQLNIATMLFFLDKQNHAFGKGNSDFGVDSF